MIKVMKCVKHLYNGGTDPEIQSKELNEKLEVLHRTSKSINTRRQKGKQSKKLEKKKHSKETKQKYNECNNSRNFYLENQNSSP